MVRAAFPIWRSLLHVMKLKSVPRLVDDLCLGSDEKHVTRVFLKQTEDNFETMHNGKLCKNELQKTVFRFRLHG